MVVVNKGGGAGAEGFLDIKNSKGDAHKIVITPVSYTHLTLPTSDLV